MSDKLASTLASIQKFMAGVNRRLDQIESSRKDHHPVGISTDKTVPHASQTVHVLPPKTSHGVPFHILDHCETAPPPIATVSPPIVTTIDDTRLAKQEARDNILTASLAAKFRMPYIERYSGINCPKIYLRLYNTVMKAHGINDAQLVAIFPMSLMLTLMYLDESRRPPDRGQTSLFLPLSVVGGQRIPFQDLKSLVHATSSVKEAIARGLWIDTAPSPDGKGKKPIGLSSRTGEVDTISYQHQRPAHHSPYRSPTVRAHFSHPQHQYQSVYVQ
ncbi:hypothetical protein CK203_111557 [Vitis vinifera]|uniref:Uncharacterized protein n=1 Tax=Vitis vinifera TaxID=29760 RepID=A0A438BQM4_VITVI|nr:hypothetical protein CK203_111557 [Vitis vinifera]